MVKSDDLAEWQLRIIQEYGKSGSSILEHNFTLWLSVVTGVLGALALSSLRLLGGPENSNLNLLGILFVVALVALILVERDSKKRAKGIQKALRILATGRPVPQKDLEHILKGISGAEDTID
jgi:hypothetical protein